MPGPGVSMLKHHYRKDSLGSCLSNSLTGRAHASRLRGWAAFSGSVCCGPKYHTQKVNLRSTSGTAVRTQWPEAVIAGRWHVDRDFRVCASTTRQSQAQEVWKPSAGLVLPYIVFYLLQGDPPSSPSDQMTASALTRLPSSKSDKSRTLQCVVCKAEERLHFFRCAAPPELDTTTDSFGPGIRGSLEC